MLRVSLLGNLGGDPEARYTPKGTQVVSFRAAVNQIRTGPDGERQENTEWFRVTVSGRQTEFVSRLSKGSRVLVFGRLTIGHYQSKDGENRTSFDVWADDVQAVSSARPYGTDPEAIDAEGETREPALAGVSSLGASAASRTASAASAATTNGKRTSPRNEPASGSSGADEELEDLPF
jgi:single-strand DNA-binding protein